jgi:hypothetical protein
LLNADHVIFSVIEIWVSTSSVKSFFCLSVACSDLSWFKFFQSISCFNYNQLVATKNLCTLIG